MRRLPSWAGSPDVTIAGCEEEEGKIEEAGEIFARPNPCCGGGGRAPKPLRAWKFERDVDGELLFDLAGTRFEKGDILRALTVVTLIVNGWKESVFIPLGNVRASSLPGKK